MRNFLTIVILVKSLAVATPGAFADWHEVNRYENYEPKLSKAEMIEAAAQSISAAIGADAGVNGERYLRYARRLAATLDQKTTAELDAIFGEGSHYGLGS